MHFRRLFYDSHFSVFLLTQCFYGSEIRLSGRKDTSC